MEVASIFHPFEAVESNINGYGTPVELMVAFAMYIVFYIYYYEFKRYFSDRSMVI